MGRKRYLTTTIHKRSDSQLSQKTTIKIARMLSRDHRTIKIFVQKASKVRSRSDKGHFRIIEKKEMTVLKMATARNPIMTSRKFSNESNIQVESRTSRRRIIQGLAERNQGLKSLH